MTTLSTLSIIVSAGPILSQAWIDAFAGRCAVYNI